MRNIFSNRLGRASMVLAIAGSAIFAAGTSAQAGTFISHAAHWGQRHGYHGPQRHYVPHHRWNHRWASRPYYYGHPNYYGPRYYAPPVMTYRAPYW
jgi:hypothetical protein